MFTRLRNKVEALHKSDIEELHYIAPRSSLPSIMQHGILSHKRAVALATHHEDVSNSQVQFRRDSVLVPRADTTKGRLALHRHANLYLNAHNPMLFVLVWEKVAGRYELKPGVNTQFAHQELCVLRIHREILERPDVMLSTCNAAVDGVKFFSPAKEDPLYSPRSAYCLTAERIPGYEKARGQIRQAEALFPYQIDPSYIGGIFVSCNESLEAVRNVLITEGFPSLSVVVNSSLFYLEKPFVPLSQFAPLIPMSAEERAHLHTNLPESSPENSDDEGEVEGAGPA